MSERIKIRALGSEAQGISSLASGKTVFVDGLLVGEEADIEVISEKSHIATGKVIERLCDSPDRVNPVCPHYELCGGCSCMHMSYEAQAKFKENKVREVLGRIGRFDEDTISMVFNPIVATERIYGYRNHMQYSIGGMEVGFRARDSHEVIGVTKCYLEYECFRSVRDLIENTLCDYPTDLFSTLIIRGSEKTSEYLIELVSETLQPHEIVIRDAKHYVEVNDLVNKIAACLDGGRLMGIVLQICSDQKSKRYRTGKRVVISGVDYYHEKLLNRTFRIKAGAFFQVNTEQAEKLYSLVKECVGDANVIYDLFCGTGSIGLCAVNESQRLFGIEVSPEAVASAKVNAELSGVKNASFVVKQAERFDFDSAKIDKADTIIVDPPRKGLDVALISKLLKMAPEKIVYVSCDPATLARDLKMLCDKYEIKSVTPVDLFPNSEHVETCVLLSQLREAPKMKMKVELSEFDLTEAEVKATYTDIKEYVKEHTGLKVSSLYIAQIKQKFGIIERECFNLPKSEESKQPKCPEHKEKAIVEALKYFKMI